LKGRKKAPKDAHSSAQENPSEGNMATLERQQEGEADGGDSRKEDRDHCQTPNERDDEGVLSPQATAERPQRFVRPAQLPRVEEPPKLDRLHE
jgi:hypothetical protein